jgi:hypothetical protein
MAAHDKDSGPGRSVENGTVRRVEGVLGIRREGELRAASGAAYASLNPRRKLP